MAGKKRIKAVTAFKEGDRIDLGGGVIWTMSARAAALFSRKPRKPRRIVVPRRILPSRERKPRSEGGK